MLTVDHVFCTKMYYAFANDLRIYFVMPQIRGSELYKYFKKNKSRFTEENIKLIVAQIVEGVGHLHDLNIAHRDLKPENVMLDDKGYVKLIDFGMSKKIEEGKLYRSEGGSLFYMAPELFGGQ